jgi:(S)-ureidoglycine aminohydrolase
MGTRAWVLARPMSGFAETFAQSILEIGPGGGSDRPEPDAGVQGVLFSWAGQRDRDAGRHGP